MAIGDGPASCERDQNPPPSSRCSFGRQDQAGYCKNALACSVMRAADLTGAAPGHSRRPVAVPWVEDLFDSPNLSLKKKLSRCVHTRVLGNCHAKGLRSASCLAPQPSLCVVTGICRLRRRCCESAPCSTHDASLLLNGLLLPSAAADRGLETLCPVQFRRL